VFTIGDFSRLARVSCRLLRYYDELGLLRPATVDTATGYRYYSAKQLPRLNRILVLKDLGFSLEEIPRLLDEQVDAGELRGMLLLRRAEVERSLAAEAERLRSIETRIAQIDTEGRLAADDVRIRAEPARRFLSVRATLASFAAARSLVRAVAEETRRRVPKEALGSLMAVAHAPEFEADSIDVQIGFSLLKATSAAVEIAEFGALGVEELPAIETMATCVRIGLPEHAHLVTARIAATMEARGFRLAGPSREVFLEPPKFERMQDSVVEMQFPVAPL
jgi:DNA-binding transcriptional MerR regulator